MYRDRSTNWCRMENSRRNDDQDGASRPASRFQESDNSRSTRHGEVQSEHNRFSTPVNNFSVLEETFSPNPPVQQQFQNLFCKPVLQNNSLDINRQNLSYDQSSRPNHTSNTMSNSAMNQINFSPSMLNPTNLQRSRNSDNPVAPVARVPTFTPISTSPNMNFQNFPTNNLMNNHNQHNSTHGLDDLNTRWSNPGSNSPIVGSWPVNMPSMGGLYNYNDQNLKNLANYSRGGIINPRRMNDNFTDREKAVLQSLIHMDKE